MSSIGEISLLYINKAHVLNMSLVSRRMLLIYMASTTVSMILTPLFLNLFYRGTHNCFVMTRESGKVDVNDESKYSNSSENSIGAQDIDATSHIGNSRRRRKENNDATSAV